MKLSFMKKLPRELIDIIFKFTPHNYLLLLNKKYYEYLMRLRNHGALGKYDHKFSGRNSR